MAEVIAMLLLLNFQDLPYALQIFLDASIMVVMIFPLVYFLSLRPLIHHIERSEQAEQSLLRSTQLQERFFDSIDTLIAYMDRDFNFIRVNEAYAHVDGQQPEYFKGKNHFELYPHMENQEIFQRVVEAGEGFSVYEKPFEFPDHPERGISYWNWSLMPVKAADGSVEGVVLSLVDVTERKLAKQQLERLYEAERQARQTAETLRAASQALTQSLELDIVLDTLLKHIASLVDSDIASIGFLEDETRLVARASQDLDLWADSRQIPLFPIDVRTDSFFQKLVGTGKSLIIPDTTQQHDWIDYPGQEPIRSWVGVPILVNNNIIGVVLLGKTESAFFTEEHARSAEALVSQAAVAIQNAWLFEQVRAGRERLQSLSRSLVEVQESERRYVARELHDQAGQSLSSLILGLGQLEKDAGQPAAISGQVRKLKRLTNDILEDLHRLAMDLRPASLDHLGLVPALDHFIKSFTEQSHLQIHFKSVGLDEDERLPADVETTLYRIVQEALTNVLRHAQARQVDVILERRNESLVVVIEDDGIGFDPEIARSDHHLGLLGMQERAEMLGGSLTIESVAGRGTTLVVEVPNVDSGLIGG